MQNLKQACGINLPDFNTVKTYAVKFSESISLMQHILSKNTLCKYDCVQQLLNMFKF